MKSRTTAIYRYHGIFGYRDARYTGIKNTAVLKVAVLHTVGHFLIWRIHNWRSAVSQSDRMPACHATVRLEVALLMRITYNGECLSFVYTSVA